MNRSVQLPIHISHTGLSIQMSVFLTSKKDIVQSPIHNQNIVKTLLRFVAEIVPTYGSIKNGGYSRWYRNPSVHRTRVLISVQSKAMTSLCGPV
jgi:hypothetical protein